MLAAYAHANLLSTEVHAVEKRSFNGRNIYCSGLVINDATDCVDIGVDMGEYQASRAFTASLCRSLTPHAVFGVEKQYSTLPW
jgi:hypothetical protein